MKPSPIKIILLSLIFIPVSYANSWDTAAWLAYYSFDNSNTSGGVHYDSKGGYDALIYQGVGIDTGEPGLVVGESYFYHSHSGADGGALNVTGQSSPFPTLSAFTVSVWVYFNESINKSSFYLRDNNLMALQTNNNGFIDCGYKDTVTSWELASSSSAVEFNKLYHILCTWDGSNIRLYINNSLEDTEATGSSMTVDNNNDCIGSNCRPSAAGQQHYYSFQGIIDEMGYWDAALNSTQRTDVYNQGLSGLRLDHAAPADSTPPTVTVTYPTNATHTNNWNGTLILDLNEPGNCSINNSDFNKTQVNDNRTIFINNTNLEDKNYSIAFYCNDVSNNWNNKTFWFVYDTAYPIINLYSPLNESTYDKKTTGTILLNVTYNDQWLWKCNTTIKQSNGTVRHTNYSGELGADTEWYNMSYNLNVNTWPADNYSLVLETVDTATDTKLNENPVITKDTTGLINDKTTYSNMKHGNVKFYYPKAVTMDSEIKHDRITQKFTSKLGIIGSSYVEIEGDKVTYLKDSDRPCHMIINDFGMDGYKWDCVGFQSPRVSKVSNVRYRVDYFSDKGTAETKSLTGLNYRNQTTWFHLFYNQYTLFFNYNMTDYGNVLPDKICFILADNMQFCFNGTTTHH